MMSLRHVRAAAAALVLCAALPAAAQQRPTRTLTPVAAPVEPSPSQPGEPPQQPMLRIDAPFHTQAVNRVVQDPNGRIFITGSDDKTIRIWQASDGTPLGTLRVPIAGGDEGAIYAVALSPDGSTLIAAGDTGVAWDHRVSIYFFDLAAGRIKQRLPDLPGPVNDLAFSPDGHAIAIAMGNGGGVRLINATTADVIKSDTTFNDRVTSVAFDRAGRLYAASLDGSIRCYAPDGRKLADRTPVQGGRPYSIAVAPDGRSVAVGYYDQPLVEVLSAPDLAPREALNTTPSGQRDLTLQAGLAAVTFGRDGSITAAGTLIGHDGRIVVRHWPAGAHRPVDWAGPRDTVLGIVATKDGGVALASADPALRRLDRDGRVVFDKESPGIRTKDLQDHPMQVSSDGMSVKIQTADMAEPWTVDLSQRRIGPPTATRGLTPIAAPPAAPHTSSPFPVNAITVTNWRNSQTPEIDGHRLELGSEEHARSFAADPDHGIVLLGTDYRLRVYRGNGVPMGDVVLPATVWGVGLSGDGRVAVAAVGDGTLRWFGLDANGQLTPRVAMFLTSDANRWVAWTSTGFFDTADRGGSGLAGLLLNRRNKDTPEWYSFAQLFDGYYNPDVVLARLRGEDRADPSPGVTIARQQMEQVPPPAIELRSACWTGSDGRQCQALAASSVTRSLTVIPAAAAAEGVDLTVPSEADNVTLQYGLKGQSGTDSVVDIFVNDRNGGRAQRNVSADGAATLEQSVGLDPGQNKIQLRAYDRTQKTYSVSRTITVQRTQSVADRDKSRPNLYILAVGIDHYAKTLPQLGFAVADAHAVAQEIAHHSPSAYAHTELIELYDDKATLDGVVQALARIGSEATSKDTVLIYLSGHGDIVDQRYYFITDNVPDVEHVTTTALSEGGLVGALTKIQSNNTMLFIDTCHAGAFSLDSASKLAHETGRYILAGAQSLEEELDSYDNRNGIFATAVLRGLKGGAAETGEPTVDNFDLGKYVTPLVRKLAQEKDHKQSARFKIDADDAESFPLAQVDHAPASN